jgi:glycosyltransferase involved in cell wall biosynthesis
VTQGRPETLADRAPSGADPRLPITAVVASHNEATLLARCLPTLAFCDEIIVIDLESDDRTVEVAEEHGAGVVRHELVPIAEWARIDVVPRARHDWLLFTDPDEQIPIALAGELADLLSSVADDVALVWAPIQFLFAGRPLRGTVWGGANRRRLLVRRPAVELTRTVFGGTHVRPGYRMLELPFTEETAIRHDWVDGYRDWLAKHRRYLRLQRVDRAEAGEVTGLKAIAVTPFRAFWESFATKRGYRDGLTGFALSVLWAWFATASNVVLFRELRRRRGQ